MTIMMIIIIMYSSFATFEDHHGPIKPIKIKCVMRMHAAESQGNVVKPSGSHGCREKCCEALSSACRSGRDQLRYSRIWKRVVMRWPNQKQNTYFRDCVSPRDKLISHYPLLLGNWWATKYHSWDICTWWLHICYDYPLFQIITEVYFRYVDISIRCASCSVYRPVVTLSMSSESTLRLNKVSLPRPYETVSNRLPLTSSDLRP